MTKIKGYPLYKRFIWRFGRVFLATFLVSVGTNLNKVEKVEDVLSLVVLPALSGAMSATFMAIRETGARGNYTSLLHRLPL